MKSFYDVSCIDVILRNFMTYPTKSLLKKADICKTARYKVFVLEEYCIDVHVRGELTFKDH